MTQVLELQLDTPEQLTAGARCRVYELLACAFAFPDSATAKQFASGDWLDALTSVLTFVPFASDFEEGQRALLARPPGREALERDYIHLFEVGAGKPYCPLYEGAHRGGRMKIMEELVRFFEHFGLKPASGDQPDHLCAELQFMHYLAFKQAALPEPGPASSSLNVAQRDFLYRHLTKWLPRLVARLADAREPSPFYSALASLASDYCRADLAWLNAQLAAQ